MNKNTSREKEMEKDKKMELTSDMEHRVLGRSLLEVSALGLGCWGMSHAYGRADENESLATLNCCLDQGINFLDTADVYGDGHNERLIARVLKHRRKEVVLATKFGFAGDEHGNVRVIGNPEYVRKACDNSLKRLGVGEIDLYYFHRLDPDVPIEETVGAMAALVDQGKIRYIGLSEVSSATLRKAHSVHPVTALQSEYSLWHRDVETDILPACQELGVSLVPFSPLGRGFLTGTLTGPDDLSSSDYRRNLPRFNPETMERNQAMIFQLRHLAGQLGATPSQLSLAWLLAQDKGIVPIPGMKHRKYVCENLGALNLEISDTIMHKLGRLGRDVSGLRHNAHNLRYMET